MRSLIRSTGLAWAVLFLACVSQVQAQEGFWGEAEPLGSQINGEGVAGGQAISRDGRMLIFTLLDSDSNLFMATRESTDDPFGSVRILEHIASPAMEISPTLSSDGSELYFMRFTIDSLPPADGDILVSRWLPEEGTFGPPVPIEGDVNTPEREGWPSISPDGLELYFERFGELFVARRTSTDVPFGEGELVAELASEAAELGASLSSDGRSIFFTRTDHFSSFATLWTATRESVDAPFGEPVKLGSPPNLTPFHTFGPSISADWPRAGSKLYFTGCTGPCLMYESTWHPAPVDEGPSFRRGDSNGDASIDLSDSVFTLNWLFTGGPAPRCLAAANSNGDEDVDLSDAVSLLNYLFTGGPAPLEPFAQCGETSLPTDEELGCESPPAACQG